MGTRVDAARRARKSRERRKEKSKGKSNRGIKEGSGGSTKESGSRGALSQGKSYCHSEKLLEQKSKDPATAARAMKFGTDRSEKGTVLK